VEDSDYTPWLLRKEERDFFGLCVEYTKDICDHAGLLREQLEHFLEGEWEKAFGVHTLLSKNGRGLWKSQKQLTRQLMDVHVEPENRATILRMLFSLGDVASYIGSTSYRLNLREIELDKELKKDIRDMMKDTQKILSKLADGIGLLNVSLEKVVYNINELAEIETRIDVIHRGAIKKIVNSDQISDAQTLYVLNDILNSMEEISDNAEKAGNILEIIAISHLP